MLRASASKASVVARPVAPGQLPPAALLQPRPVRARAVRRCAHLSAAPVPVLADASASASQEFVAAGFGVRGAAVCELLSTSRALPPLACWPLPGETAAANAAALKARACDSCVLLGNPAEASAPATAQLAQLLSDSGVSVCAVLALPFAFEGARKAAAAADVVKALRSCVELLVVVEQESLFQSSLTTGITLAQATAAADGVLCAAVACLRHLFASQTRVLRHADGKSEAGTASFRKDLQRLVALSGLPAATRAAAHSCFGTGCSAFTPGGSDSAAAAAITAAAYSAASTPFLSHVRAAPSLACICVIRAASPMPDAVLSAATQAVSALFAGSPLLLCATLDSGAEAHVHVDLLVLSRASASAEDEEPAAPDASIQQRKSWSAMAKLAAGTAEPRKVPPEAGPAVPAERAPATVRLDAPAAAPLPAVVAPAVAAAAPPPVVETPDVPSSVFARDYDMSKGNAIPDAAPDATQSRSKVGALLKLFGLQKTPEQSISQRASAVLANDRAASRVVVRMTFPDGSSYEGEVLDGVPHGIGRRVYSNGSWYAGEWQNGQRQGWGVSQTGGERYEGMWSQGVPTGGDAP